MLRRNMMAGGSAPPSGNTDDFSTDTLSEYTQYADGMANWAISSGQLTATTGGQSILTRNGVSFADGKVSCVISTANDAGLALRLQDVNNYYVAVICDQSSSTGLPNRVIIYKRVAGSFSMVGTPQVISPAFVRGTPVEFSFEASGTSLVVKVRGVTYFNETDGSIASPGLCGPRKSAGSAAFESFSWP